MEWGGGWAPPPLCIILGPLSKVQAGCWGPGHGGPPTGGSHQAEPGHRGLEGGLEAADLGIPNGTPDVKDELIREGKVTKPFVQGLGELIWVPFVLSKLYHGGRWTRVWGVTGWKHR